MVLGAMMASISRTAQDFVTGSRIFTPERFTGSPLANHLISDVRAQLSCFVYLHRDAGQEAPVRDVPAAPKGGPQGAVSQGNWTRTHTAVSCQAYLTLLDVRCAACTVWS
jgi:hypothetical protein